jgi:hypothetical protein
VTFLPGKAFIDTTVLTDALLKQSEQGREARRALKRYDHTSISAYAIKEFKGGPLRNYVWFYNKIVTTERWSDAVDAIRRIGATPKRYLLSTALQALADFQSSLGRQLTVTLAAKYPDATKDEMERDEARIWTKIKIMTAWRNRRNVVDSTVHELSCYHETGPKIKENGVIDIDPTRCPVEDCSLRLQLTSKPNELAQLFEASKKLADKRETIARRNALRHLHRTPKRNLSEAQCRALGDAVFVMQCPPDRVILTTNITDYVPLAAAVGKDVESP